MDDLLAEFVAESREMLEALGGELVAWEADPTDRARLDAIFRFVHTVKGNCGFFDFPRLEALSHAAEDALSDVRKGRRSPGPRLVTAVLGIVDRISTMVDAIEAGEDLPVTSDDVLIAALASEADESEVSEREPGPARSASAVGQRTIRLPVGLLDDVMASVSDLVLARNDLARRIRGTGGDGAINRPFERLNSIIDEVREAVTRMRMQRIEHLYAPLPRVIRDLAAELGKQVTVDLEGGEVELDREMIEMIRDPLIHIIRNAIDHGIEEPAARRGAGKPDKGTIRISARQSGNRILLGVADDGRGIDGDRLVDKAVEAGLLSLSEGAALSERDQHSLIFEPGLSTAKEVTAVSGRGVGMDVVRANIERIGGSIEVSSSPANGTRILLSLPLTLSIIPSLTVEAGGQLFAMPRSYVEEIVHGRAAHIEFARAGDAVLVTVRGRRIACLSLSSILGTGDEFEPEACTLVLLRLAGGDLFAVACDRVFDHEELVIKPLAPAIMATGIYAGSTLLDDGNPVLMLDVAGIARQSKLIGEVQGRARASTEESASEQERQGAPAMLFVGLDGRRKAVRLSLVDRIERIPVAAIDLGGEQPRAVLGDDLLALAGAEGGPLPREHASVLRLSDGCHQIAYIIDRIIDSVELPAQIVPAAGRGPVEGTAIVGGELADVLDGHWLFARYSSPFRGAARPLCRLPASDPWAQVILAPLVRAAGYTVVNETYAGEATVAIATDEGRLDDLGAATVIQLSADPDGASPDSDRFYRYDREGLLNRLAALRAGGA